MLKRRHFKVQERGLLLPRLVKVQERGLLLPQLVKIAIQKNLGNLLIIQSSNLTICWNRGFNRAA